MDDRRIRQYRGITRQGGSKGGVQSSKVNMLRPLPTQGTKQRLVSPTILKRRKHVYSIYGRGDDKTFREFHENTGETGAELTVQKDWTPTFQYRKRKGNMGRCVPLSGIKECNIDGSMLTRKCMYQMESKINEGMEQRK